MNSLIIQINMTQEPKTELATLRQQLIEAQENTTVIFFEAQSELKLLYTQGSLYLNTGINNDDDSQSVATIVSKINKKEKEVEESRMAVTRLSDKFSQSWINRQREITKETTDLKKELIPKNNQYLTNKEKKAQEAKEKIQKEKDRQVELLTLPTRIANCYATALTEEIANIRSLMAKSWANLTSETFEAKMEILKNYNHKITYEKALSYFTIEPKFIKPDEVDSAIKNGFNYEKFCEDFRSNFTEIKKSYLDKIDSKRVELKTQSENARLANIAAAEKAQKDLEAKEAVEKYKREQALLVKTADIVIQQELNSQAKTNTIKTTGGRTNWEAYFVGEKIDWQRLMELYVESEGTGRLEFLLMWAKKDRPEIEGLEYKSSKVVINRG